MLLLQLPPAHERGLTAAAWRRVGLLAAAVVQDASLDTHFHFSDTAVCVEDVRHHVGVVVSRHEPTLTPMRVDVSTAPEHVGAAFARFIIGLALLVPGTWFAAETSHVHTSSAPVRFAAGTFHDPLWAEATKWATEALPVLCTPPDTAPPVHRPVYAASEL